MAEHIHSTEWTHFINLTLHYSGIQIKHIFISLHKQGLSFNRNIRYVHKINGFALSTGSDRSVYF